MAGSSDTMATSGPRRLTDGRVVGRDPDRPDKGRPVLRIHFTYEDLARTRIVDQPDPLWETVLSLTELHSARSPAMFGPWRRWAAGRVDASHQLLLPFVPPMGYFADFLTPADGSDGLDAGIDAVLHTPRRQLQADTAVLAESARLPTWVRDVSDGRPAALLQIGEALRSYHRRAVAPQWPTIVGHFHAERARWGRAVLDHGWAHTFNTVSGALRWRPPVLEADYPVQQELHLGGRGILIVPSYFCWRLPITLLDPQRQPVLVVPVRRDPVPPDITGHSGDRWLAALVGHTRAAVLRALEVDATTTVLSHRVGTSVASASQHAAVLRKAGLITTRRQGGSVVHSLTPLGASLLHERREHHISK